MLLQLGVSGLTEVVLFNLAVSLLLGYFTYRDASARPGVNATLWAVVMVFTSFFLPLIGFVVVFIAYYVVVIRE